MARELESASEINRHVNRLLRKADAYGVFPTPVDHIVAQAELVEESEYILDEAMIKKAPAWMRAKLRSAAKKIQGLVDRRARVIHISPEIENVGKKRFVKLHETIHHILPHQQDLLYADDHETLSPSTNRLFEREANQGAAELLFQRDGFARDARDYAISTATVCLLADRYGSSIHSALRRYAETHDAAVAAIVLERTARTMSPPTWVREEFMATPEWEARFGAPTWPRSMQTSMFPFLAALDHPELDRAVLIDTDGDRIEICVDQLQTPYKSFILLWVPPKRRLQSARKVVFARRR